MDEIEAEARRQIALAERTLQIQRARLAALQDPVTAIAAKLHDLLGCRWCSEPLHFEPGYSAPNQLDGWAISQQHVNRMYMNAAARIEQATRGTTLADVANILNAVVVALREGDAERFAR